jgi:hypothetical protein
MTNPGIVYVSSEINKLVKTGQYLGMINAGLKQRQAWHKGAEWEPAPVRDGQDFRINEAEPAKPKQQPSSIPNPDSTTITDILFSGETKRHQKHGYYTMVMNKWRDLTSVKIDDLAATFKDTMKEKMQWISDSAGLTRELQCRRAQLQAYLGGNAYATAAFSSADNEIELSDTNGFTEVIEAGVPFPVSSSHPLKVFITNGTLGTVERNVTGCTPGTLNEDDDTVPGTITLSATIAEIDIGDQILSEQAPVSVRPGGKSTSWALDADDKLSFNMVIRIAATMKDFNIRPHSDGLFHFTGDSEHFYDLWQDSVFREAYRGQYNSSEWKDGNAIQLAGVLFDFSNQPANSENEAGVLVKRFLVTGQGALKQGYYKEEPKQTYADIASSPLTKTVYDAENRVRHIVQMPINVYDDVAHMAWEANWGFAPRRDALAHFGKKPKASYKRGVGGHTA